MSVCSKCKEEKELKNRRYCEKCTKEIWRISNQNKLQKIKDIISDFKTKLGDKCQKCDEDRKHVLEFHHIDPSKKEDNIPTMLRYYGFGKSNIKRVEEEVDKCILLCANCHKDLHFQQNNQVAEW